MNEEGEQFYEFVKAQGIDVPNSYGEFKTAMQDANTASQFHAFVSSKNIDVPESVAEFQSVFSEGGADVNFTEGSQEPSQQPSQPSEQSGTKPSVEQELPVKKTREDMTVFGEGENDQNAKYKLIGKVEGSDNIFEFRSTKGDITYASQDPTTGRFGLLYKTPEEAKQPTVGSKSSFDDLITPKMEVVGDGDRGEKEKEITAELESVNAIDKYTSEIEGDKVKLDDLNGLMNAISEIMIEIPEGITGSDIELMAYERVGGLPDEVKLQELGKKPNETPKQFLDRVGQERDLALEKYEKDELQLNLLKQNQGTVLGAAQNTLVTGVEEYLTGTANVALDMVALVMPEAAGAKNRETALKNSRQAAKDLGISVMTDMMKDEETYEEYRQKLQGTNLFTQGVFGALQSLPAMLSVKGSGMFSMMYGTTLKDLENIDGLSEVEKTLFAATVAGSSAVLEKVGFDAAVLGTPLLPKIITQRAFAKAGSDASKDIVERAIQSEIKTVIDGLKKGGQTYAKAYVNEGVTEGAQQGFQQFAEFTTNVIKNKDVFEAKDFLENLTEIYKAGASGGFGGGFMSTVNVVKSTIGRENAFDNMSNEDFDALYRNLDIDLQTAGGIYNARSKSGKVSSPETVDFLRNGTELNNVLSSIDPSTPNKKQIASLLLDKQRLEARKEAAADKSIFEKQIKNIDNKIDDLLGKPEQETTTVEQLGDKQEIDFGLKRPEGEVPLVTDEAGEVITVYRGGKPTSGVQYYTDDADLAQGIGESKGEGVETATVRMASPWKPENLDINNAPQWMQDWVRNQEEFTTVDEETMAAQEVPMEQALQEIKDMRLSFRSVDLWQSFVNEALKHHDGIIAFDPSEDMATDKKIYITKSPEQVIRQEDDVQLSEVDFKASIYDEVYEELDKEGIADKTTIELELNQRWRDYKKQNRKPEVDTPPSPVRVEESLEGYDGIFAKDKTQGSGLTDPLQDDVRGKGYFLFQKDTDVEVVMMSPDEYLRRVREGFGTSKDEMITDAQKERIKSAVEKGDKIDMPYLDYRKGGFTQEGRNRAQVAKELGEESIPVLIARDATKQDKNVFSYKVVSAAEESSLSIDEYLSKYYNNDAVASIKKSPAYKIAKKEEQDAIQEQTAGEVPVQPEAKAGEKVEEGEPKAEPEITTEEGKEEVSEEEKVAAAKQNLQDAWNKWKEQQRTTGIAFDPRSRAEQDVALTRAVLDYLKAIGAKTIEDVKAAVKDLAGFSIKDEDARYLLNKAKQEKRDAAIKAEDVFIGVQNNILNNLLRARKIYFSARKFLPRGAFKYKEQKLASIAKNLNIVNQNVTDFNRAFKKYKGDKEQLIKDFDAFLRTEDPFAVTSTLSITLPDEFIEIANSMRNHIDGLSRELVDGGYVTEADAEKIRSNLGEYITRAYEVYTNKNWKNKVQEEVKQKARNVLRKQLRPQAEQYVENNPGENVEEILDNLVDQKMAELLDKDGASNFLTGSKLGAKDLSILKQRTDIPFEIRALMGEYTDPMQSYAMTIQKLSALVANARFLNQVKENGMGVYFFEKNDPKRPKEFNAEIAPKGSDVMNPLNGLYTTPEIAEEFNNNLDNNNLGNNKILDSFLFKTYMKGVSTIKWVKTIGSFATHIKNVLGNGGFLFMNGHHRIDKAREAYNLVKNDILKGKDKALRDKLNEYIEKGIIKQSAGVGEIRDMFKEANFDDALAERMSDRNLNKFDKAKRKLLQGKKFAEDLYQAEDDFFKIIAYENEKIRYSDAIFGKDYDELTQEQKKEIDDKVVEIVKNTYPTYDRVPEIVQFIRRFPLVGNFVSFQAESYRTMFNSIAIAKEELKSDNPKIRKIGASRIAGAILYESIKDAILTFTGIAAGTGAASILALFRTDEEEEKDQDARKFVAPWSKNSDLIWLQASDGKLRFIDFSASDPHGGMRKVINNAVRADNPIDAFTSGLVEFFSPFVDEEILFKLNQEIINNKSAYGGMIYNPEENIVDKSKDILNHFYKGFEPGTITSAKRLVKASGEDTLGEEAIATFLGLRIYDVDVAEQFGYKTKDYTERLKNARKIYSDEFYDKESTREDRIEKYDEGKNAYKEVMQEISDDFNSAERLGADVKSLYDSLKKQRFSKIEIEQILTGKTTGFVKQATIDFQSEVDKSENLNDQQRAEIRKLLLNDELAKAKRFVREILEGKQ